MCASAPCMISPQRGRAAALSPNPTDPLTINRMSTTSKCQTTNFTLDVSKMAQKNILLWSRTGQN